MMRSQLLTGITKQNKHEVFPASPSLLKELNIPLNTQNYIAKRNLLLSYKSDETVIYDKRLRPYQNADVHFLMHLSKGKGVFNEQRTGKTPTTLVTLRVKNQNKNIIIIPKSGLIPWQQEYKKWHGGDVFRVRSWWNKSKRIKKYEENSNKTIIINYKKLTVDLDLIIENFGFFDAVILDEAHMLRNFRTNAEYTTYKGDQEITKYDSPASVRAIMAIRKLSADAYALTGTPSPTKQENIYGILAFLFPKLFKSYNKTMAHYFNYYNENVYRDKNVMKVNGFKNQFKEQSLLEFIETFSVQRKRKDVMGWIPEVDKRVIWFDMPPKIEKWHTELEEYFETEDIICVNELSVMLRQRQLCVSPLIFNLNELGEKFKWIIAMIKDYPKKPIVITGFFTTALEILKELLKTKKISCAFMSGQTSETMRESERLRFQNGKTNVIIGNISVMALGLNLSRAEELIIIDESLIEGENDQIADRIIPTIKEEAEKKDSQMITRLLYRNSVEEFQHKRLKKRASEIEIINDYKKYLEKRRK